MKTLIIIIISLVFAVCGIVVAEGVLSKAGDIRATVSAAELLSNVAIAESGTTGGMSEDADSTSDAKSMEVSLYEDGEGDASIRSMAFNEGTTIRGALSMLSKLFKRNIIPSPEISGTVTVSNLYDVSFEEALAAVIGSNKYTIKDNFIRVYTLEEYQQNKGLFASKVITLYYISAAEAEKLITPLLSEYGSVASTTPAMVDTKPGKGGDTVSIRDTLVVQDMPDRVKDIEQKLSEIDKMPPQILIEVTILEAKLTETTQFGIDFDILGVTTATANTVKLGDDAVSSKNITGTLSSGSKGLSVGVVQDHVRVFIRALEDITDATVLANPKILALNKQAGKILIGNEDGYLTTTQTSDAAVLTQEVAYLETGTKLEFRPFICKNGMIRMEIFPEQSTGSVNDDGLPEKATTTVQTNVMVKDGKTIVLGGLFKEKTTLANSQVPILGDIPLLGGLFRNINDVSIRTELIILITPHIINDPEETEGAERLADVGRLAQKARKNIAWISRTRRGEDQYSRALRYYDDGDKEMALCTLNSMWESNRQYLEVDRLRERIIKETEPDYQMRIERIMLGMMEDKESKNWIRH